jgi:recombination associated protein RdgC
MPALTGTLSYARFYVDGELPDGFRERFMRAIRYRVIEPLGPDDDALERSGWSVMGEPFELELRYDNVFYNDYVNLGFRVDKWAFPSALLKTRVREAEALYKEKKGRERLGKRERAEIKELVLKKLKKQFVPNVRSFDLSWSLNEGLVRFFSQSAKPCALMQDLFAKTFHLKLIPETPYTLAERQGLNPEQVAAWDALELTLLVDGVA